MTYPIKELITRDIEATLKGIQASNGYKYSVRVERYIGVSKYVPDHLLCIVYQDGEDRDLEDNNKDSRWLRVAVDVFVMPPPNDPTPVDVYSNVLEADMVKALYATYTRGGYAVDTICDPADPFATFGEADGFTLMIKCKYRTVYGDPYRGVG